jgi:hypothetical protein
MGKTLYTIFCGRRKYLEIQQLYFQQLLDLHFIDEIHLWLFTTNMDDLAYLHSLHGANPSQVLLFYPNQPERRDWKQYYDYYLRHTNNDDIVIKVDDDILYIDIQEFPMFLQTIQRNHSSESLFFPNIINNDVCGYFQQLAGKHYLLEEYQHNLSGIYQHKNPTPLTTWYMNPHKAHQIHQLFLENPLRQKITNTDLQLVSYHNRISINFFGVSGLALKKLFRGMVYDDEVHFGMQGNHKIYLPMTVVHFQFAPQNRDGKIDANFLHQYAKLASNLVDQSAKLASNLVDQSAKKN